MIYKAILLISLVLTVGLAKSEVTYSFLNVRVTMRYHPTRTDFYVSTPFDNGVSVGDSWLGIGFNSINRMEGASVVVCTNLLGSTSVQHYFNTLGSSTILIASNPMIGLTNVSVSTSQGNMICSFSRDNINENPKYFDITQGSYPYLLIAYGTGSISYHKQNRYVTPYGITLNFSNKQFNSNIYLILFILVLVLLNQ